MYAELGRTVAVQPDLQIVSEMLDCVTARLVAPGVTEVRGNTTSAPLEADTPVPSAITKQSNEILDLVLPASISMIRIFLSVVVPSDIFKELHLSRPLRYQHSLFPRASFCLRLLTRERRVGWERRPSWSVIHRWLKITPLELST